MGDNAQLKDLILLEDLSGEEQGSISGGYGYGQPGYGQPGYGGGYQPGYGGGGYYGMPSQQEINFKRDQLFVQEHPDLFPGYQGPGGGDD